MLARTFLSVLALAFLLNCGGRTPPFTADQRGQIDSGMIDPDVDGGIGLVDAGMPPIPDTGFFPDGGAPPRPDVQPPRVPDAGQSDCEFGPQRVCNCLSGLVGTQTCEGRRYGPCVCPGQPPLPNLNERQQLARIFDGMVGDWEGIGENQWEGEYPVTFNFRADRSYSARCERPNCVALYWASDNDDPAKDYTMFDVFANGEGDGKMTLAGDGWGPQTGDMTNVYLSPDENFLRFEFYNTWSGRRIGPVKIVLQRN